MAIQATIDTDFGESRSLYIRINNIEASNHGMPATALLRGYVSKAAFTAGKAFVWEREVTFVSDVSLPLWGQGYSAAKTQMLDPADPLSAKLAVGSTIADV